MPIYFSSEENKFYNADLLKGVSGFDFTNENKFYPVSETDYKNILKQTYVNNLDYNFVGGETGFLFTPKSLTFSSKEERMEHLGNLIKKHVNFRRCYLGYPKDIEAYISSGETSWSIDAQAFINWKSDVEKTTNDKILEFVLGLTTEEPSFSRIVTSNDFPQLRYYNTSNSRNQNSFFVDRIPNKLRDNTIINLPSSSGPTTSDCTSFDPYPQFIETTKNFGFFRVNSDHLFDSYSVGESVGITHYNTTANSQLVEYLNKNINFNSLVENIFFAGNLNTVKYPILQLIETSPDGSTGPAAAIFVPSISPDEINGDVMVGGEVRIINQSNLPSYAQDGIVWGSPEFWEIVYDDLIKPNAFLETCCGDPASTGNFYNSSENPCGLLSSCAACNSINKMKVEIKGPYPCYDGVLETLGGRPDLNLPKINEKIKDNFRIDEWSLDVFDDDFSCNYTQDSWTGSPCCPLSESGGERQQSCPIYLNGEPIYPPLGPCDCCWDYTEVASQKHRGSLQNVLIISEKLSIFEHEICWVVTIEIDYYCSSINVNQSARSCGCPGCPCQHVNCEGVTGCEDIIIISPYTDDNDNDSVL
jgi:hypothetical protein